MNFVDAVKTVLTVKYAAFTGRARRSEYWWYILFTVIVSIVLSIVDRLIFVPLAGMALAGTLFSLATLVPSIAAAIRRMHDKDLSGWWILVPFYNIYLLATPGTPGPNRFGPEPAIVS